MDLVSSLTSVNFLQPLFSSRLFLMDITNNVASIIGNIGVGYIIQYLGYFWAFGISAVLFLVGLVYEVCVLRETIEKQLDSRFLSLGHVKRACMLYVHDGGNNRRWKLQVNTRFVK